MSTEEKKESLIIEQCAVGGFDDNFSYVIVDPVTKYAALVDPSGDVEILEKALATHAAVVKMVLITHSHFDHVDGVEHFLQEDASVVVYAQTNAKGNFSFAANVIQYVDDEDEMSLGDNVFTVVHTPGHCDDAVCYYEKTYRGVGALFTGDTLFVEGCGRTTRNGVEDLWKSLQRLVMFSSETVVYPGHNYGSQPRSTIGWEKQHNHFLRSENFDAFKKKRLS